MCVLCVQTGSFPLKMLFHYLFISIAQETQSSTTAAFTALCLTQPHSWWLLRYPLWHQDPSGNHCFRCISCTYILHILNKSEELFKLPFLQIVSPHPSCHIEYLCEDCWCGFRPSMVLSLVYGFLLCISLPEPLLFLHTTSLEPEWRSLVMSVSALLLNIWNT